MDFLIKQYLIIFFDFENYGILNWLAIPLLIYFFITIKKRKRWEMALALIIVLSCLSLCIQGRNNPRYILTLYPFTLAVILLFGWEFIKRKSRYLQICILVICGIFVLFNYYHSRDIYKQYWRYKVTFEDYYFPYEVLRFINNIENMSPESSIFICGRSFFNACYYYYSNKKGINYRNPEMDDFYLKKDKEEALNILKDNFKVKYIYLSSRHTTNAKFTEQLRDILTNNCDLVSRWKNELYLYRIREKDLDKEELEESFVNDSLLKNGSFENWAGGASRNPDFFKGVIITSEDYPIREEKEVKAGKYSAKITGDNFNFYQYLSNFEDYKGKNISCFVWVKTEVPNKYRIELYDGIKYSYSKRHWGGGNWELLQTTHKIDPSAEFVNIRVIQAAKTGAVDDVVYVDGALLVEGDWNTFYQYSLYINKKE